MVAYQLALYLRQKKFPRDAALATMITWNYRNRPPLKDSVIDEKIKTAYEKTYSGYGCDEDHMQPFCVEDCPVYRKKNAGAWDAASAGDDSTVGGSDRSKEAHDDSIEVMSYEKHKNNEDFRIITPDLLPEGLLKEYVNFAYPLTEAPMQYHIATGLTMTAALLGRRIFLKEGMTTYYPNLYTLVIGESGITRKSTSMNLCYEFLPKIDPQLMLGTVMSLEGCLESLQIHGRRLVVYDELKQLITNEEKSYGKGLITLFTTLWGCPSSYMVSTKNVKPDKRLIIEPTLSILAATTPDWLELKERDILGGVASHINPSFVLTLN